MEMFKTEMTKRECSCSFPNKNDTHLILKLSKFIKIKGIIHKKLNFDLDDVEKCGFRMVFSVHGIQRCASIVKKWKKNVFRCCKIWPFLLDFSKNLFKLLKMDRHLTVKNTFLVIVCACCPNKTIIKNIYFL